ncbi:nucleotide disphospho-sugar-binding domain-containing protein [Devosia sp.]|uniref:nucleotide disphospho-sugar-binding domain-containing protein n=1 Tax=Devosia sp. TaxID=1871048 RepID=UPI0035ADB7C1
MKKIVVLSMPAYGHLLPMLGPIAELVRRGHDVVAYSSPEFEKLIRATGAGFVAYPRALDAMEFAQTLKSGNLIAAFEKLLGATPVLTDFVLERLPQEHANVVVFDSSAFWGYIAVHKLKLPNVSDSPIFAFELMRNLVSWRELWGHTRNFVPRLFRLAALIAPLFRYGIGNLPRAVPMVPLRGERTIMLTSRELHPPTNLVKDPSFVFPGASIDARTRPDPFDFARLDGRPVILISMGTVQFLNDRFFRLCMDTFADFPAQFLLAAGPGSDVTRFGPIPDNFIVQQTFPQMPVLERAALFITHCGLGSVHETLWNGVPFVAVPQHFEQLRNALAAERHGAGIILDDECFGRRIEGPQLRATVEKVLADPVYRQNALRIGETLKSAGGYQKVADVIESVAR